MGKKLQVTITSRYPWLDAHFRRFEGNNSEEACRLMELGRLAETLPKLIQRTIADALRDMPLTVASASVDDSGGGEDAQAAARLGAAAGGYFDEDD